MICIDYLKNWTYEAGRVLLSASCVAMCNFSYADNFSMGLEDLGIYQNTYRSMPIIPIRLMDNETLFLSAEAEKDTRMSFAQKLINNRWLAGNSRNTYSGGAALGKYLRMNLRNYWENRKHSSLKKSNAARKPNKYSEFTNIQNYDLRVSDERIKLEFEYKF